MTSEPPNLSICGKQEPISDLSARRDPSGFNEARIGRHLRFVLGIHAVNTLSRRRVSFEIDYRDLALGHAQEVNVAAEEHAIFGCSCDRVLELKLRPRFADEAFSTQRVEGPCFVGGGGDDERPGCPDISHIWLHLADEAGVCPGEQVGAHMLARQGAARAGHDEEVASAGGGYVDDAPSLPVEEATLSVTQS